MMLFLWKRLEKSSDQNILALHDLDNDCLIFYS